MKSYRVFVSLDVDAEDTLEAAKIAKTVLNTSADGPVLKVLDCDTGEMDEVDPLDIDDLIQGESPVCHCLACENLGFGARGATLEEVADGETVVEPAVAVMPEAVKSDIVIAIEDDIASIEDQIAIAMEEVADLEGERACLKQDLADVREELEDEDNPNPDLEEEEAEEEEIEEDLSWDDEQPVSSRSFGARGTPPRDRGDDD